MLQTRRVCALVTFGPELAESPQLPTSETHFSEKGICNAVFLLSTNSMLPQDILTIPHNPLQPLHDLDSTSPQFHEHLIDFIRGKEYRDAVPGLKTEDLAWLVEYLDNVSPPTISPHATLDAGVDRLWYLQSRQCPISGIATRTQEDMRAQGGAAEIVHTFGVSSGLCIRGNS